MASVSATSVTFGSSLKLLKSSQVSLLTYNGSGLKLFFSSKISRVNSKAQTLDRLITGNASSLKMVTIGWAKSGFPSLRTCRFRVSCSARPETVQKVCEIVRKQLALSDETELTPDSKFSSLGADSLDTVEIVMGLEEEFGISVEEENSQNITTVQEAADMIEKLVEKKSEA